jgi:hypothetical protein
MTHERNNKRGSVSEIVSHMAPLITLLLQLHTFIYKEHIGRMFLAIELTHISTENTMSHAIRLQS